MPSNVPVIPTVTTPARPSPTYTSTGRKSYPVRQPEWVLFYRGVNVTRDILGMVVSVTFKDGHAHHAHSKIRVENETDTIEITLEDRDRRWQGPWYPQRGDTVSLQIGYVNENSNLDCGDFQVDELELKGPPDQFHLKCISTGITPSLRTKRSVGYENSTLFEVATIVAARNGLIPIGVPTNINVTWNRITQNHETDLAFLRRLALAHNYDFTVRGNQLVFYSRSALETKPSIAVVTRTMTEDFEFKDTTMHVYATGTVNYWDPHSKSLITATAADPGSPTGDDLNVVTRSETPDQAGLKAGSALHDANMNGITGRLQIEGAPIFRAGMNLEVRGFGNFDGTWHIDTSEHKLERTTGYTTTLEIRKI